MGTNVYWATSAKPGLFNQDSFSQWRSTGKDPGSVNQIPVRESRKARLQALARFSRLKAGLYAVRSSSGRVYGDPAWRGLASRLNASIPAVQKPAWPPPVPPVKSVNEDFESYMPHMNYAPFIAAIEAHVDTEGKGDSIRVTDEAAASGTQALK